MYVHKETLTINDPKTLYYPKHYLWRRDSGVEVTIMAYDEDAELESLRTLIDERGITEADVKDAIAWARTLP